MGKTKITLEPGNEAPAVNENEVPKLIKIALPQDLYEEYSQAAEKQGLTVTELILHRLRRCASHTALRGLYFSDSQRAQLENLLQKRPVETSEQALALLTASMSVRVGEFAPVPITAQQAKRIVLGAYGGKTPQDHLRDIVQGAVARATGI